MSIFLPDGFKIKARDVILCIGLKTGHEMLSLYNRYRPNRIYGLEMNIHSYTASYNILLNDNIELSRWHVEQGIIAEEDNQQVFAAGRYVGMGCTIDGYRNGWFSSRVIDYLYCNIGGDEKKMLKANNTAWPRFTRFIKVELHEYDPLEALADARKLGFDAIIEPFYPDEDKKVEKLHLIGWR